MIREEPETSRKAPLEAGRRLHPSGSRSFRWHAHAFVVVNVALGLANFYTGRPWWAFWPLLGTGAFLAVHYLIHKAAAVDERWVDARVEELNLKSYDRSHIEGLKARLGEPHRAEDRRE